LGDGEAVVSGLDEEPSVVDGRAGAKIGSDMSVAALLLTIGHDQAARVIGGLDPDQSKRVTKAMNALRDKHVDRDTVNRVLVEAMHRVRGGGHAAEGPAESVTDPSAVEDVAREPTEHEDDDDDKLIAKRRFAVFEALSSSDLANLLAGEHPQIAAVFIAHLDRAKAAAVVNHMAEAKRPDLVYRVATLDRTPHDVVQRVLDVMTKKVESLGLTVRRTESKTWIRTAAEIVNKLGSEDEPILRAIEELSTDIADSIRDEMFTFEDVAALSRRSIQSVLAHVDTRTLVLALKATSPAIEEIEEKVFDNLSKRAREMVSDARESLGPVPASKVFDAQRRILRTIRELASRGEIESWNGAGEPMV
jgi:flagellar motor switch protein FliG